MLLIISTATSQNYERCYSGEQYILKTYNDISSTELGKIVSAVLPELIRIQVRIKEDDVLIYSNSLLTKDYLKQKLPINLIVKYVNPFINEDEFNTIQQKLFDNTISNKYKNMEQIYLKDRCEVYIPPSISPSNKELTSLLNELKTTVSNIKIPDNKELHDLIKELKTTVSNIKIPDNKELHDLISELKTSINKIPITDNTQTITYLEEFKKLFTNLPSNLNFAFQLNNKFNDIQTKLNTISNNIIKTLLVDYPTTLNKALDLTTKFNEISKNQVSIRSLITQTDKNNINYLNAQTNNFNSRMSGLTAYLKAMTDDIVNGISTVSDTQTIKDDTKIIRDKTISEVNILSTIQEYVKKTQDIFVQVSNIYQGTYQIYQHLVSGAIIAGEICAGLGDRIRIIRPYIPLIGSPINNDTCPINNNSYSYFNNNSHAAQIGGTIMPILQNDWYTIVYLLSIAPQDYIINHIFAASPDQSNYFNADSQTYEIFLFEGQYENTFGINWSDEIASEWRKAMRDDNFKYILITMKARQGNDIGRKGVPLVVKSGDKARFIMAEFTNPYDKTQYNSIINNVNCPTKFEFCHYYKQLILTKSDLFTYFKTQNVTCMKKSSDAPNVDFTMLNKAAKKIINYHK